MNPKLTALLIGTAFFACTEEQPPRTSSAAPPMPTPSTTPISVTGKEAVIYTTASETSLRLAETGKATFAAAAQPLENEVSIFVNDLQSFVVLLQGARYRALLVLFVGLSLLFLSRLHLFLIA